MKRRKRYLRSFLCSVIDRHDQPKKVEGPLGSWCLICGSCGRSFRGGEEGRREYDRILEEKNLWIQSDGMFDSKDQRVAWVQERLDRYDKERNL